MVPALDTIHTNDGHLNEGCSLYTTYTCAFEAQMNSAQACSLVQEFNTRASFYAVSTDPTLMIQTTDDKQMMVTQMKGAYYMHRILARLMHE